MMTTARKEYYDKQLGSSQGNTVAIWRLIRKIVPSTKKTSNGNNIDNNTIEEFNHFFADVGREAFEFLPKTLHQKLRKTPRNTITNTPAAKTPSVLNPSTPAQSF